MTPSAALTLLRELLSSEFEVPEDQVRLPARLSEDLDLDSLDVTELLQLIEEHTTSNIANESLEGLVTLGDMVDRIVTPADVPPLEPPTAATWP
jgi:acyl carrier protein